MKLAFVINDLSGGGAEKALLHLAEYLTEAGVSTRIFTLQSGNDGYEPAEGIEKTSLKSGVVNRGIGRILGLPLQAFELSRHLRSWQPDVCVSFLPRSNIAHVMTRWFGNRNPVLLTEQCSSRDSYPSSSIGDRVMRRLISSFYPKGDHVFPSSEGVKDGLVDFGVDPERMGVVYNTISLPFIQEKSKSAAPAVYRTDCPTIITVGRYAEQKDQRTLLRAFAELRASLVAQLVLVGQGPLEQELQALAQDLEIESDVVFAGWQDNPYSWLAHADLFVLSSRYEGFGNVIVEAMACGLPIVSTDCPSGPSEILKQGEAGILVPVGDASALAAAMKRVLADSQLHDRLAGLSKARAPDFDINVIGAKYLEQIRHWEKGQQV